MKIATFNINGVKARLLALTDWLTETQPDVALLQEIKSVDDAFPRAPLEDLGYNVETHGQKGFNGVAILSKRPIEDVRRGLPGDDDDLQARWIEATVSGASSDGRGAAVRLCGLYLPNGNPAPGPKYDYKLAWMERLRARAADLLALEQPVALLGDYNVIPEPRDVHDPAAWAEDALFLPNTRAAFRRLMWDGWTDAYRALHDDVAYTFWDYQAGAWRRNAGIRIDHALLSPQAADRLTGCGVDRAFRGRDDPKPSDHAPLWITLDL
jgi:exodeoxyribonuclease-3